MQDSKVDLLIKREEFKYLGCIVQENGGIAKGGLHGRDWMKIREATSVLCNKKSAINVKGKFYKKLS